MRGPAIKSKSPLFARLPQLETRRVQGKKPAKFHSCVCTCKFGGGGKRGVSQLLITGPNELAEPKTAAPVRDPLVMNGEQEDLVLCAQSGNIPERFMFGR